MNFANALVNELNNEKTFTENGAVAYATSGKKLLDFNFAVSQMRKWTDDQIEKKFSGVFFEDPLVAVKFLFWLRDCREGNGERRIFRVCLKWLAENKTEVARRLINLIPEYGRFDDLWVLLDTELKDTVIGYVDETLTKDLHSNNPSLLAKWCCSENSSSAETKRKARIIREGLRMTPRAYRKMLSSLRKNIDVVECKMSAKEWDKIIYENVPSLANLKYNNAFLRNDEDRRRAYLELLKNGNTKINASVLQPHEIVNKYVNGSGWHFFVGKYDETLEQLWKALPNLTVENVLCVRDGSGSMCGGYNTKARPIDVATALAVYTSEHNHGIWKDKFITFSAQPKFINLSNCGNLHDKLTLTYNEDDCSNTNIEKTMMLILNTAIKNKCSQEDMPGTILIISDMGWDSAAYNTDQSLFDFIAEKYKANGYLMPKIVFWNVAGNVNNGIPIQQNELGVVLMSGFSVQLLKMVMSNQTDPYKVLLETINASRYQPVEDAVKDLI